MIDDKLQNGETIVRICPHTHNLVLAQYVDGQIIDLHNDNIEQDIAEVIKFICNNAFK